MLALVAPMVGARAAGCSGRGLGLLVVLGLPAGAAGGR